MQEIMITISSLLLLCFFYSVFRTLDYYEKNSKATRRELEEYRKNQK